MRTDPDSRCRPHRIKELGSQGAGAPKGNDNAFKHGYHSPFFNEEEILEIHRMASEGDFTLNEEIATTKLLLRRTLRSAADPAEVTAIYTQGARDLAYLLKAKRIITGGAADDLAGAFAKALDSLAEEFGIAL